MRTLEETISKTRRLLKSSYLKNPDYFEDVLKFLLELKENKELKEAEDYLDCIEDGGLDGLAKKGIVVHTIEAPPLKKIEEDLVIHKSDSVTFAHVYTGFMFNLKPAELKWRLCDHEELGIVLCELKLSEIAEQLKDESIITIFIEGPFKTEVLQYGNYGDSWYHLGEIAGYA